MSEKPPAPSDIADKFMLRLPNGMRERISEEAKKNKRSMNAEIVSRLEESLSAGEIRQRVSLFGHEHLAPTDATSAEAAVRGILRATEQAIAEIVVKHGIGATIAQRDVPPYVPKSTRAKIEPKE
jgi:hypothetical protein